MKQIGWITLVLGLVLGMGAAYAANGGVPTDQPGSDGTEACCLCPPFC